MCFLFFVPSCYYLVFWFSSCFHCIFHLKLDVQLSLAILILIYYLSFTKCYFDASVFINLILKKKNNPVRLAQLLSFVVGCFFFLSFLFIYLFIYFDARIGAQMLDNCLFKIVQLGGSRSGI